MQPCLAWSQLGSGGEQSDQASGVDLLEVAGEARGAPGGALMPSPGSAVTWLCRELPADSPAENSAATVCGSIPGGSLGSALMGTGTDVPRATPWSVAEDS